MDLDLEKVFHMNGGRGSASYSNNSSLQKKTVDRVKHIASDALIQMFLSIRPRTLAMADLGCSSGPNTLSNIKQFFDIIEKTSASLLQPTPEIRVYLNDLPTNDFNAVFRDLPEFFRELSNGRNGFSPKVYIGAYPGSFYRRIFPEKSLNFVYSFNSLHWLSKIPPGIYNEKGDSINRNSIYISERSPPLVSQAYYNQFHEDFSVFLKSRSEEVIPGGKMVLLFLGRTSPHHSINGSSFFWEILYQSISLLVSEGEIPAEKLETYDVHFYAPSKEELEEEVRRDGSFKLEVIDMFDVDRDAGNCPSYGVTVAGAVRSIQESMLVHHFGCHVLDKVFDNFARLVDQELASHRVQTPTVVLVLTKL